MRGDVKGEPNSNFNHFYHLRGEDFLMEWVNRKRNNYIRHARRDIESHGTEDFLGDCCGI